MEDDVRQCFSAGGSGPKDGPCGRTLGPTGLCLGDELWVVMPLRITE